MKPKLIAILLFLLTLIFYLYTLQPSLAWGDGIRLQREVVTAESFILAEMVDVEFAPDPYPFARLGVAAWDHPLYVMIGHSLVRALPGLDSLWLVNAVSAVFGAAAIAVLFLYCQRHLGSWIAALYAAVALALSHTFWWHASTPEVYTLFAFLLLLAIYWYDRFEQNGRKRYLLAAAFALGLGAANHLLAFLSLPALGLYWLLDGRWRRPWPRLNRQLFALLAACLLLFLLGFAPYWIQVLRLLRTFPPQMLLGPAIGTTFFRGSLALSPGQLLTGAASYLIFLLYQFNPLGVGIGIYGWWSGRSLFPRLWKQSFALYLVYLLFGLVYQVSDQFAFFLGSHLFWAVAMGMGVKGIEDWRLGIERLRDWETGRPREWETGRPREWETGGLGDWRLEIRDWRWWVVVGGWVAVLVMPLVYGQAADVLRGLGVTEEVFGVPQVGVGVRDGLEYYVNPNKRGDTAAYHFGTETLANLPSSAVILAEWYTDTDEYFVLRYFTVVEGRRPDVEIVGWPTEDPFLFDSRLATELVAAELPDRPVYLASLSTQFYDAPALLADYCIVPENHLYRIYPHHQAEGMDCLAVDAADNS